MTTHSPEQNIEIEQQKRHINPLQEIIAMSTGLVNTFRAVQEERRIRKQSEQYVDSLFVCYLKGTMSAGEFLSASGPRKAEEMGLDWYAMHTHALFTRMLGFHWYGRTDGIKINLRANKKSS